MRHHLRNLFQHLMNLNFEFENIINLEYEILYNLVELIF
jgi:hypothetical protein